MDFISVLGGYVKDGYLIILNRIHGASFFIDNTIILYYDKIIVLLAGRNLFVTFS